MKSKHKIKLQSDKYEAIVSCQLFIRWRKQYGKSGRSSGSKQWRTCVAFVTYNTLKHLHFIFL